jgi:SAM-dependent methyltransferase
MDGYDAVTYGHTWAGLFDSLGGEDHPDTEASADRLAAWARPGPALELGIGTGRVALPIAQRGVEVHGVDISADMLQGLSAKPGADAISTWMGNFAEFTTDRRYALIYIVASTFFMLLDADDQRRCLTSVARTLSPTGRFVLEAEVPNFDRFVADQSVRIITMRADLVEILVAQHHPNEQRVDYQRVRLAETGTRLLPLSYRYAWPAELDAMAESAGLRLEGRYGGWHGQAFDPTCRRHVSCYVLRDAW